MRSRKAYIIGARAVSRGRHRARRQRKITTFGGGRLFALHACLGARRVLRGATPPRTGLLLASLRLAQQINLSFVAVGLSFRCGKLARLGSGLLLNLLLGCLLGTGGLARCQRGIQIGGLLGRSRKNLSHFARFTECWMFGCA